MGQSLQHLGRAHRTHRVDQWASSSRATPAYARGRHLAPRVWSRPPSRHAARRRRVSGLTDAKPTPPPAGGRGSGSFALGGRPRRWCCHAPAGPCELRRRRRLPVRPRVQLGDDASLTPADGTDPVDQGMKDRRGVRRSNVRADRPARKTSRRPSAASRTRTWAAPRTSPPAPRTARRTRRSPLRAVTSPSPRPADQSLRQSPRRTHTPSLPALPTPPPRRSGLRGGDRIAIAPPGLTYSDAQARILSRIYTAHFDRASRSGAAAQISETMVTDDEVARRLGRAFGVQARRRARPSPRRLASRPRRRRSDRAAGAADQSIALPAAKRPISLVCGQAALVAMAQNPGACEAALVGEGELGRQRGRWSDVDGGPARRRGTRATGSAEASSRRRRRRRPPQPRRRRAPGRSTRSRST